MEGADQGEETLMPNDKEFELDDLESFSFDDISLDEPAPGAEESAEDPLGVWVKKAPEDVDTPEVDSPEVDVSDLAEPSFDLPDLDLSHPDQPDSPPQDQQGAGLPNDSLAEEDYLSSEELANLDDSFDFVTVEEPLEGESLGEDAESTPGTQAFDEVSLDDFVGFEDPTGETSAPVLEEEEPEEGEVEDFLDIDIDIEDDIKDDELEILEGGAPVFEDEFDVPDTFSAESVDLSEFADFEELAPLSPEGEESEDELPEVKDLPAFETGAFESPAHEEGFFEEKILEEELPPLDLEPADHTDLDHIMALEETLTSGFRGSDIAPEPEARPQPETSSEPQAGASGTTDLAALILGKLEQELSSIKKEISDLKREVTSLRAPGLADLDPAAPLPSDTAEPAKAHGFFDEEDDETIALTGDELDNILSTAEVSEGEEVGVPLDEDLLSLDAEGNLVTTDEATAEDSEVHVTDEEFLAGTSLDVNEPEFDLDASEAEVDQESLGVPESIELEEMDLPEDLGAGETDDLLAEIGPPPEFFDDSTSLEIPSDLELSELSEPGNTLVEEPLDEGLEASVEEAIPEPLLEEIEAPAPLPAEPPTPPQGAGLSPALKDELRAVLSYMDKLLASLPDEKIQEFAESEHFEVYKKLFEELGLIE